VPAEDSAVPFHELFADFRDTYLNSEQGSHHASAYDHALRTGRENYAEVQRAKSTGSDFTDLVLRKLLPHTDSKSHEAVGAWIHVAPAITADIRTWYEASGIAKPEEWPAKAALILDFIERAVGDSARLDETCRDFASNPLSKGLQSGMLTPILNALKPDTFCVFNSKVKSTLSVLKGKRYRTAIEDYPRSNAAVRQFVIANRETIAPAARGEVDEFATFDMFCHWFVAVRDTADESELENDDDASIYAGSIDRRSAADAAHVIERICPDGAPRATAVAECLRVIREAHSIAPAGWSVTLKRRIVRVNVGGIVAFDMRREGVYLVVHEPTIDPAALPTLKQFDQDEAFKWIEGADGYLIPYSSLEPALSLLRAASQELVKRSVVKSDKAPFKSAHSPGVLEYLRQQGHDVPDPAFYSRRDGTGGKIKEGPPEPYDPKPPYLIDDCAAETSIAKADIESWIRAINRKGQAILYGPPGTGKTFVAERLARLLAGADGHVDLVQFHPAYAYEDFIQGLRPRPRTDGSLEFVMEPGRFIDFCDQAAKRAGTSVLIIDEINRANLPQVLGELMYLLEYRDREIPLSGGGRMRIPPRVRIIGTMNTADRSIALVDHALRRRFAFLHLEPKLEVLERFHAERGTDATGLVGVLKRLNQEIKNPHYSVGISFFMRESLTDDLPGIWSSEIEPYLEEYFFDKPEAVDAFRWEMISADVGY
jgi:hypothetical protein